MWLQMNLKHWLHNHSPAIKQIPHTMTSTMLYDKACIAAEKANTLRFNTKTGLSAPDELCWYNNNTNWDSLSRKEFSDIMIRMESITAQFYEDFGTGHYNYPHCNAAIRKFWADEWRCEYLPESGHWFDLVSNNVFQSQTENAQAKAEKKAKKAAKKAEKKAEKKAKKEARNEAKALKNQYNDEEEDLYRQALDAKVKKEEEDELYMQAEIVMLAEHAIAKSLKAQKAQAQAQAEAQAQAQAQAEAQKAQKALEDQIRKQQQQQLYDYDDWYDAEEEVYAETYAKARAMKAQQEQREAQAYLAAQEQEQEQAQERTACQPVFYFEELTKVKGDPDWRAYIYYDAGIRRYVFKGTRRSVLACNKKKTQYPEVKLCFRSSRELASYLRSSTDNTMNVTMFAMTSAVIKDATFAELCNARGCKTELFGYDRTRPRYSTFVDYLRMTRDVDAGHSTFAAFA